MAQSGYSHRSLPDKLGLKPGMTAHFVNPPKGYFNELGSIIDEIEHVKYPDAGLDFGQLFTTTLSDLATHFPALKKSLNPTGMLWVSWPKGASKIPTDLNENHIRDFGLDHGLVDVKVIAVDEDWSGLKFIYRLKDRA